VARTGVRVALTGRMDSDAITPVDSAECFAPEGRLNARFLDWCESNREHVLAALPFNMAELADGVGFKATFALAHLRGGRVISVPKALGRSKVFDVLAETIGDAATARLVELFETSRLEIPLCTTVLRMYRDSEMARLRAAGISESRVTEAMGLAARTVRRRIALSVASQKGASAVGG
jgi:hypothetical protein